MMTLLLQILAFTNIPVGGTVTLPHGINVNGVQQAPDFVALDQSGFVATVTNTTVSVTNNSGSPGSVNVWLELKHTIPRQIGAQTAGSQMPSLVPRPFISAAGGGGGGGSVGVAQVRFVNKGGNDLNGDGTLTKPFLTIRAALASITDASGDKPYAVEVGPGIYADDFDILPWVAIVGAAAPSIAPNPETFGATTITGMIGMDASWADTTAFAWLSWLHFPNSQTLTWPTSAIPALAFSQCTGAAGTSFEFDGNGNGEAVIFDDCVLFNFAGLTAAGVYLTTNNCQLAGVTLNNSPSGGPGTIWYANSCSFLSNITVNWTAGNPTQAQLLNCAVPLGLTLTLNGAGAQFMATVGGVPPSVTLLNGASPPALWSNANTLGYTPGTPANWQNPQPASVQDAIDRLASALVSLVGPIP